MRRTFGRRPSLSFQPRAIVAAPQGVGAVGDATIAYANIPPADVGQAGCGFGQPNVVVVDTDNERVAGPFWVRFED
jgi:hypothetical protein